MGDTGRGRGSGIFRLYPNHRILEDAGGIYGDLTLPRGGSTGGSRRPYVVLNMVSSVVGKARAGGGASGIGGPADRTVMRTLRSKADAVMIGAGTLRAEKLSLALDDAGADDQPIGVIVSSGARSLPTDHLTSLGKQRTLLLAPVQPVDERRYPEDGIEVLRVPALRSGDVDLSAAVGTLHRDEGVGTLLVEGGPSLNAALLARGLVDELFLTLAPRLLTGDGDPPLTILEGIPAGAPSHELRLLSAHAAGDELFLRYGLQKLPTGRPTKPTHEPRDV